MSVRNHLAGTVRSVETSGVRAEVEIELGDGQVITSMITSNSVDRLGIAVDDEVSAVIKATEVVVNKDQSRRPTPEVLTR